MKTYCLDCKSCSKDNNYIQNITEHYNINKCLFCWSKNTFLVADNVDLKDIQDSITEYFLEEFNLNK